MGTQCSPVSPCVPGEVSPFSQPFLETSSHTQPKVSTDNLPEASQINHFNNPVCVWERDRENMKMRLNGLPFCGLFPFPLYCCLIWVLSYGMGQPTSWWMLPLISHLWGRPHRYTEVCPSNLLGTSQSTKLTNKMIHHVVLAVAFFTPLCFLFLEFVGLFVSVHLPFLIFALKQCLTYSPGQI